MLVVARNVMKPATTISPSTKLAEIIAKMETLRISILPVVDGENHLVGVVSKTDVLHTLLTPKEEWRELAAVHIMSPAVVSCQPSSTLAEVAALMEEHRVHHILVIDDDGALSVISALDLTLPLLHAYNMISQNQCR